jgi:hypothetical protein
VELEEGTAEVDLEGIDEEELAAASLSDSVADLDQAAGDVPASSRRPIQLQPPLEELAFGDAAEPKPAHPVPPESRRQVAIPATDFDGELSGVRATPETPAAAAAPAAPRPPTAPPPPAAAAPVEAQVIRGQVAPASPAVFRGAPPAPQAATFGELLDQTLGL